MQTGLSLAIERLPGKDYRGRRTGRDELSLSIRLQSAFEGVGGETKQIGWIYSFKSHNSIGRKDSLKNAQQQTEIIRVRRKQTSRRLDMRPEREAAHAFKRKKVVSRREAVAQAEAGPGFGGRRAAFGPELTPCPFSHSRQHGRQHWQRAQKSRDSLVSPSA